MPCGFHRREVALALALGCLVAVASASAASVDYAGAPKPKGKVSSVRPRACPPQHYQVRGTLSGIPRGRAAWVAVLIGDLLWPKARVIMRNEVQWVRVFREESEPPDFALALLMVRNERIPGVTKYMRCRNCPGLRLRGTVLRGSVLLDVVDLC
jgi:hypothetical protein